MDKVIQYKILTEYSDDDLMDRVHEHLKAGYVLQGGVSKCRDLWMQAMVKHEPLTLDHW